jgi:hypothetical protein
MSWKFNNLIINKNMSEQSKELIEITEGEIIQNILNDRAYSKEDTNRLTSITDEVAKKLSETNGWKWLNGVKELSLIQAEYLAGAKCEDIHLDGLTSIDDLTAMTLSEFDTPGGSFLYLNGLTELSDVAAKSFSRFQGELHLTGLTSVSDRAVKYLAEKKYPPYLNEEMKAKVESFRSKDNK